MTEGPECILGGTLLGQDPPPLDCPKCEDSMFGRVHA